MSPDKRSALMARIRGKNTKPELLVRQYLWHAGFRYRLHASELPGRPDLVLPRWRAAVFVHGCFWHRHAGCPYFRLPKTRTAFWDRKLAQNRTRDTAAIAKLVNNGWRVAVVWECAVRTDSDAVGQALTRWINRSKTGIELATDGQRIRNTKLEGPAR